MLKPVRRKGQTLPEVMVALVILVLALSSTFILIISVLNMVLSAQNRTTATSLAQKGLAEGRMTLRSNCMIDIESTKINKIYTSIIGNDMKLEVFLSDPTEPPYSNNKKNPYKNKFKKMTAVASWIDKGGVSQNVTVSQMVRLDGE